jgi:nicotinamidase-related amidase
MANPRGDESCGALLLIDFQDDFLSDSGRMPVARNQVSAVIAAANAAIDQSQVAGDLILKIGNEFRPSDVVGNAVRHHAAIAGSPGSKWDPRVGSFTNFSSRTGSNGSLWLASTLALVSSQPRRVH